jgi:hypothetical protein
MFFAHCPTANVIQSCAESCVAQRTHSTKISADSDDAKGIESQSEQSFKAPWTFVQSIKRRHMLNVEPLKNKLFSSRHDLTKLASRKNAVFEPCFRYFRHS